MPSDAHTLLLATPPSATLLPGDPAIDALAGRGASAFLAVVAAFPQSSLLWALLAEGALSSRSLDGDLSAYAFARTGYHRGLDALRRAGWRGKGPIPWAHEPNQGFLRAVWALACAARRTPTWNWSGRVRSCSESVAHPVEPPPRAGRVG